MKKLLLGIIILLAISCNDNTSSKTVTRDTISVKQPADTVVVKTTVEKDTIK